VYVRCYSGRVSGLQVIGHRFSPHPIHSKKSGTSC